MQDKGIAITFCCLRAPPPHPSHSLCHQWTFRCHQCAFLYNSCLTHLIHAADNVRGHLVKAFLHLLQHVLYELVELLGVRVFGNFAAVHYECLTNYYKKQMDWRL